MMPNIQSSSKQDLHKNAQIEMAAGKSRAQAWAIAYSIQRKNKRKKRAV